ncbi:MAG: WXG100 family type VII secretion target [Ardenticatenaceae bacterium]|nr:WXG100 family type VII secretion target [Anaerolineales bacterium]MCB9006655.1 WXG100 family type VII secretion target [Ardenticatenaceae bacterium]
MSKNDIKKMNYPMVERMARTMDQSAKRLENCLGDMNKVISTLEQGGLRGDAGAAFSESVRGPLNASLKRLQNKFNELNKDLRKAEQDMKQADKTAARAHRS